ncbi:MAG: amidohydrolase family protein [Planctomycetota bacterium]|nr:amidohydrolase family protein [Planctomycetota bacterium]
MNNNMFLKLGAILTTMTLGTSSWGQSRQIPAPVQSQPIVIHSATIHTVSGDTIVNGYVAFDQGIITAIGQGSPPNIRNAQLRDATGLHVYPGLIAANTNLGLSETGAVPITHDFNEFGDFTPETRCIIAVNPDTDLIPVTRANGILTAVTSPSGGVIAGRNAIIRLDGWTWEDLAIQAEAGLILSWPSQRGRRFRGFGPRRNPEDRQKRYREGIERIEQFFEDASAYLKAKDHSDILETDLRFEAMRPFVMGEKPIYVQASSQSQIEEAVAFAQRRSLKIIIVGGFEADRASATLVKNNVPVILNGLHRLPSARHSDYDEPFTLPLRLHEAGVKFCIASGTGSAHERNLNHITATAAAYGLPKLEALRSITLNAAEILGLGDTHGSIETGKTATLIVTTGDPLEITTDVILAYIDGRDIDLGSRHKQLFLKYREKYKQLGLIE